MNKNNIPRFPDFRPFDIHDRQVICGFTERFHVTSCEYSFTNLFCWQDSYKLSWSIHQDHLVIYNGVNNTLLMPVGEFMPPEELSVLPAAMEGLPHVPEISSVPEAYIDAFEEINSYYLVRQQRAYADYLYSVSKLSNLTGKKLQKKKNLISQFKRKFPGYEVTAIDTGRISEIRSFADSLFRSRTTIPASLKEEHHALMTALDHFDALGLEGLVIRVDGRPAAFSVFSRLNPSTFDIHFEKAAREVKGSAQVINHETAKYLEDKCTFLNREQDLGIPGLRQAKMSYDPDKILAHSTLSIQTCKQETHSTIKK